MNWRNRPRPSSPDVCETILPLLSLQADGMASADESRRVESHLKTCDDCRRAQSWMQATHLAIAQRPLVVPPPDLRARIAQAVAAQAAPVVFTTRRPLVLRPAFAVAASLALAAAWVGHELLTVHPTAQPSQVADATHATPSPTVKSTPSATPTTPPKLFAKTLPALIRHAPTKTIERVATAPQTVTPRIAVLESALPVPTPRPTMTPHAPLIAKAPAPIVTVAVKPRTAATPAPKIVHMATAPRVVPQLTVPSVTTPDLTPPPVVIPEAAPTVAAVKPVEPTPASTPEPAPMRVARRADALSVVRAHLTSSQSDSGPRHITRDPRVQAASYAADGGLTPYYGMVYTPTHQDH
ncbi:MAG: zf-HC2 domain-containing protein [Armatimonadota bacterium]|nr:zf-HC2 domain-containing protein [Armatimonadota bacterium]